jgi:hypothetical protein
MDRHSKGMMHEEKIIKNFPFRSKEEEKMIEKPVKNKFCPDALLSCF